MKDLDEKIREMEEQMDALKKEVEESRCRSDKGETPLRCGTWFLLLLTMSGPAECWRSLVSLQV